ncbi:unnamed protein product [Adineta steineri]|uniref:Uncharacterized protein n=2 Tax=Adineta steineri TaxID=433720 RepID=A0A819LQC9_9BILA|nr:unnamed protein product [Adineta steineri]CAF4028166.1 unnamed protein product [Adineta steineri]
MSKIEQATHIDLNGDGRIGSVVYSINLKKYFKNECGHLEGGCMCVMPISNILVKSLSESVKCPICLDYYNDPRLLPCLHTFCFTCITELANHCTKSDHSDAEYRFICPLRDGTFLTQHQLKDLPVNQVAKNMVELLLTSCSEKEDKVPCDFCTENSGKRWCLGCCQQFCSKCLIAHNSETKHITVPIAERAAYRCNKHIDEVLKLWCTYCKLPVCSTCLTDDNQHSQHLEAIESIYKIVNETRTSMETCLQ